MKTVGKITRPFKDDLNQIPYDFTVEVTKIFKGSDLIDRVPKELWKRFIQVWVQEALTKPSPRKRNARRQSGCLRESYKTTTDETSSRNKQCLS